MAKTKVPKDVAASVRQRLLDLTRREGRVFDAVLVAFGLERLIHRLSVSAHRNRFVPKGGMLVMSWTDDSGRHTRDVDFLAFGTDDRAELVRTFAEIMMIDANDGLVFDTNGITVRDIRKGQTYGGSRLRTTARLGQARIPITIDLGFGDALGDPAYQVEFRSLLDFGPTLVRACSPATVVAEKFHAIVVLGLLNTRMKDLHDLVSVPATMMIDHDELARALAATFQRRETALPDRRPPGLTSAFADDPAKIVQWTAYSDGTSLEGATLAEVVDRVWAYVGPAVGWRGGTVLGPADR